MNPLDTAGGAREMEAVLEQKGKRSVTFTQKKKPKKNKTTTATTRNKSKIKSDEIGRENAGAPPAIGTMAANADVNNNNNNNNINNNNSISLLITIMQARLKAADLRGDFHRERGGQRKKKNGRDQNGGPSCSCSCSLFFFLNFFFRLVPYKGPADRKAVPVPTKKKRSKKKNSINSSWNRP